MDIRRDPGFNLLDHDCDELLAWSGALQAIHTEPSQFMAAWLRMVVPLLHKAMRVDAGSDRSDAMDFVIARCNSVLRQLRHAPLPNATYLGASMACLVQTSVAHQARSGYGINLHG